jgi:hypothetical protein
VGLNETEWNGVELSVLNGTEWNGVELCGTERNGV